MIDDALQESLEEEKLEKYKAMGGMKQLKTELEGLKEWAARKPVQKAKVCILFHCLHT